MKKNIKNHKHKWVESDFVIDTLPATYTIYCDDKDCDADSHDGGKTLCDMKHFH